MVNIYIKITNKNIYPDFNGLAQDYVNFSLFINIALTEMKLKLKLK